MHPLPDFALRLGIELDADERTIKRNYARELKNIDLETNADAFQQLRAAYEEALFWLRAGGFRDPSEGPAAASADLDHGCSLDGAMSSAQAFTYAAASFSDFLRRWADAEARVEPMTACCQALQDTVDNPGLMHVEARVEFESAIAQLLAGGWRPGHQFLFIAALKVLNWSEQPGRLRMFGEAGHDIEMAIGQRAMFGMQTLEDCALQSELMERLRDPAPPSESELARLMPADLILACHFPHWTAIITDAENLKTWRERDRKLPLWRRLTVRDKGTLILGAIVFLCYVVDRYEFVRRLFFNQ